MKKINIPSKYKFELMKSRGVGTHPSDNEVGHTYLYEYLEPINKL